MRRISFVLPLVFSVGTGLLVNTSVYAVDTVFEQRFNRIQKQAATGDRRAQYRLGLAYMLGNDVKVDIGEAIHWLEKSAEQGYVKAAHKLGVLYFNNRSGRKNYAKAVKWFTVAAKRNYAPAQYFLAKMYFVGKGVTRDLDYALVWSARAGKNGMNTKRQLRQIERAIKARSNKSNKVATKTKTVKATPKIVKPPAQISKPVPRRPKPVAPKRIARPGIFSARSRRHVLELVLSGYWMLDNKPADHMPSAKNKCTEKKGAIHCRSERLSRSTNDYRADYKVNSTFFNFNRTGQFNVQYRITYLFVLPFDSDDPNPSYAMPAAGKSKKVIILNCQTLSKTKIRCLSPDKKVHELYTKN